LFVLAFFCYNFHKYFTSCTITQAGHRLYSIRLERNTYVYIVPFLACRVTLILFGLRTLSGHFTHYYFTRAFVYLLMKNLSAIKTTKQRRTMAAGDESLANNNKKEWMTELWFSRHGQTDNIENNIAFIYNKYVIIE
jgi:hypothetical protein